MQADTIDKSKIKSAERNEPTYDIILTKRTRLKAFQSVKYTHVDENLHWSIILYRSQKLRSHTDHFRAQWSPAFFIFLVVLQISEALGVAGIFQFNGINILYCTNHCKIQCQERIFQSCYGYENRILTKHGIFYKCINIYHMLLHKI